MLRTITILGVSITNEREEIVLEYLLDRLRKPHEKTFIVTPNPEMLVYASKHPEYKSRLNHAGIALPDGVGLVFAAAFKAISLKERITGVDFIEKLCMSTREKPLSMGFLGGKGGVAEEAFKCLKKKYPWINVAFVGEEWNESGFLVKHDDTKGHGTIAIDILFVAYGIPKQEEWIYGNLPHLPVKAAMGVGGAFDFLSGSVPRAPMILRILGMEWLFRLVIQPWRWRRQLALVEFIGLVFKEKFTSRKS